MAKVITRPSSYIRQYSSSIEWSFGSAFYLAVLVRSFQLGILKAFPGVTSQLPSRNPLGPTVSFSYWWAKDSLYQTSTGLPQTWEKIHSHDFGPRLWRRACLWELMGPWEYTSSHILHLYAWAFGNRDVAGSKNPFLLDTGTKFSTLITCILTFWSQPTSPALMAIFQEPISYHAF